MKKSFMIFLYRDFIGWAINIMSLFICGTKTRRLTRWCSAMSVLFLKLFFPFAFLTCYCIWQFYCFNKWHGSPYCTWDVVYFLKGPDRGDGRRVGVVVPGSRRGGGGVGPSSVSKRSVTTGTCAATAVPRLLVLNHRLHLVRRWRRRSGGAVTISRSSISNFITRSVCMVLWIARLVGRNWCRRRSCPSRLFIQAPLRGAPLGSDRLRCRGHTRDRSPLVRNKRLRCRIFGVTRQRVFSTGTVSHRHAIGHFLLYPTRVYICGTRITRWELVWHCHGGGGDSLMPRWNPSALDTPGRRHRGAHTPTGQHLCVERSACDMVVTVTRETLHAVRTAT